MFVRKTRSSSGAVTVQVMRKVNGRDVVVAHVGSAHTDADLGILLARAGEIAADGQQVLDFEVPVPVARMADVADWRAGELVAPAPAPAAVTGAARTVGSSSRLLYEVIGAVYDALGFGLVGDEVLRDLVIARIVEPTSKADSIRVLAELGVQTVSYRTIQRRLARVGPQEYRDLIAAKCFEQARDTGGLSLILYDVTTLYFEADKEDDLRKVGYSKERRVDPQIVVGLLVDRLGFPLEISCFDGATAETNTIVPVIEGFRARHGITKDSKLVIAADAGMLSRDNLKALDAAGFSFIVGSRMAKAPNDLESHFHWHGQCFTDGQIIDTVTPRHARSKVNNIKLRAEPVWDPEKHPKAWRAVWQYSASRARRDTRTLDAQQARAEAAIDGTKPAKSTRFVTLTGDERILDEASLQRARRLIGLKGYVTNVEATAMPPREVIAKYHDLWQVERSFRMSKHDLATRPIYHRTRDAIEAHLTIAFAALAVARRIQNQTGLAIGNVLKQLRPLRTSTVALNGTITDIPPDIPAAQRAIITSLGTKIAY